MVCNPDATHAMKSDIIYCKDALNFRVGSSRAFPRLLIMLYTNEVVKTMECVNGFAPMTQIKLLMKKVDFTVNPRQFVSDL